MPRFARIPAAALLAFLALGGCMPALPGLGGLASAPPPAADAPPPAAEPARVADADLPEPDPARARRLGEVVAVADDSRPGLWLATSLVRAPEPGRVTWLDNGNALRLRLVPAPPGGPARLSAEAMRALGIPLAARPRLIVWRE